jgi:hypothetical protein|tara:strand:+ start:992 stop:1183 length:192 start_codon:yes stop_codon:yes gene_type:complete
MPKTTKKVDKVGMSPAVHRKLLDDQVKDLNQRIDDLIDDFTTAIKDANRRLDKVCVRLGLPKS